MNKNKFSRLVLVNLVASSIIILLLLIFLFSDQLANIYQKYCLPVIAKIVYSQKVSHGLNESLLNDEVLRFAVIGEPTLGSDYSNGRFLQGALQKAKEKGVKFVIVPGDLVDNGEPATLARVKQILDESGLIYYTTPGNHDTYYGPKTSDSLANYKTYFGDLYKKIEIPLDGKGSRLKKAKLIFLNNAVPVAPERRIDEKQMLWLEDELYFAPRATDELIFVFMHVPLHWLGGEEGSRLRNYFCTAKIDGLFSGHVHRTEYFYSKCLYPAPLRKEKTAHVIPTFNVGAIYLPNNNEFSGFLILHYFKGGQFELERIVLSEHPEQYGW